MARYDRYELFARHLSDGRSVEDELALLAVQPEQKQQVVEHRLRAIDDYLDPNSAKAGNVDAAAAMLGVGRRQFFKLIAKVRELGPTRGLTPGFRNVDRPSAAREGLEEHLERHIRFLLGIWPNARIAEIAAALRVECELEQIQYPGESAVRRRVHALRRKAASEKGSLGVLGAQITFDQVNLDLSVNDDGENHFAILTLIIDHRTKLILGHGVTARYGIGDGTRLALNDFNERFAELAKYDLTVALDLEELTWIVPRDLETLGMMHDTRPKLEIIHSGPRRHGAAILRLIGDRLPPFSFKPMAMERIEVTSPESGIPLADARRLVRSSVDRWNEAILVNRTDPAVRSIARQNRLNRIKKEIDAQFSWVLHMIAEFEAMFEEGRAMLAAEGRASPSDDGS